MPLKHQVTWSNGPLLDEIGWKDLTTYSIHLHNGQDITHTCTYHLSYCPLTERNYIYTVQSGYYGVQFSCSHPNAFGMLARKILPLFHRIMLVYGGEEIVLLKVRNMRNRNGIPNILKAGRLEWETKERGRLNLGQGEGHLERSHRVHIRGHDGHTIVMMLGVDKDELPLQVNLRWDRGRRYVCHNSAKVIMQRRCTTSALLRMVLRLGRTRTSLKSNLMSESTLGMAAWLHTHRTSHDIAIRRRRNPAS